jgi:hypothetical protein
MSKAPADSIVLVLIAESWVLLQKLLKYLWCKGAHKGSFLWPLDKREKRELKVNTSCEKCSLFVPYEFSRNGNCVQRAKASCERERIVWWCWSRDGITRAGLERKKRFNASFIGQAFLWRKRSVNIFFLKDRGEANNLVISGVRKGYDPTAICINFQRNREEKSSRNPRNSLGRNTFFINENSCRHPRRGIKSMKELFMILRNYVLESSLNFGKCSRLLWIFNFNASHRFKYSSNFYAEE